jgi:GT2 family glycosyltransferase
VNPLVTVVIVTYNSEAILDECLRGLTSDPRLQVVVVDSGSADKSVERARAHPWVTCLPQSENVGWSAACNLGADAALAPALAFINPDTRATCEQLVTLASRLRPTVGAVAPRFINEDGSPQYFYFRFARPLTGPFLYLNAGQTIDDKLGRPVIRRHLYDQQLPVQQVDHAGAACLIVDANEFRRLGRFNERMFVFFSDMDLTRRMAAAGLSLEVDWDVSVSHLGGGTVKTLDLDRLQLLVQRDYVAYGRVAYTPVGRFMTTLAVWVLSGWLPALRALSRGQPGAAGKCLNRAHAVLRP